MDRQASRFRVQDRVSASGVGGSKAKAGSIGIDNLSKSRWRFPDTNTDKWENGTQS